MLQEQEQRILGYFIEEAKDHLKTIEQGLLNLCGTLQDTEMLNEVFRAAHSVKGGAAMLGLDSIQQTSHHLEDYFKVLQECPTITVDQKLESLFLRVFDTLQELLENLEDSLVLTEDVVDNIMSEVQPVFEALNQHLSLLTNAAPVDDMAFDNLFDVQDTPLLLPEEKFELHDLLAALEEAENTVVELDFSSDTGENHFTKTESVIDSDFTLQQLDLNEETWQDFSEDLFDNSEGELSLEDFAQLEAFIEASSASATTSQQQVDTVFEAGETPIPQVEADSKISAPEVKPPHKTQATTNLSRRAAFERTMRVPVKYLDNVSNLVGELVVNRNSLEQNQQRLRQFLDNLLHQVQELSNLGFKMQELYERSLMEAALTNSSQGSRYTSLNELIASSDRHATGANFDTLEMDRFTGFHTLSQEMIELITRVREAASDVEFVTDETDQVARQFRQVTTQLQEGLMRSRMVPFAQIAERLPRAVRDISLKYGKQAQLNIEGQETLIDKGILEQLYDPMTHLVNNSITHGIETPDERLAKGKSPVGQITIRAFLQGNQTVISVTDDGAGIDTQIVKAKAIQNGLISAEEAKTMSRLEVYNLLFHPGFSTKDSVDEFAGRGVGMDVVRTSLSEIRGTINTDSSPNWGTTFTIRLPLTLSICKALCCLSDKARIAFPLDGVEDMLDVETADVLSDEEGQTCILWRGVLLRFRLLKELLVCNRQLDQGNFYGGTREDNKISIVVLRSAGTFLAVQVDQVQGEQEIVIKQFEGPVPKPIGVAGATVLGDGRVMPIADVLELIDLAMGRLQTVSSGSLVETNNAASFSEHPKVKTEPTVLIVDDSITVRELLSMTFIKAGYRVEQARDGQEAWDKLRDGLPCDIVFCDIEMPRMDGLELLSRIQKEPSLSQLPIAMLTSRGADRHRQMAVQLGASGYFIKPYLEEALLDGAQRMLRGEMLIANSSNAAL